MKKGQTEQTDALMKDKKKKKEDANKITFTS